MKNRGRTKQEMMAKESRKSGKFSNLRDIRSLKVKGFGARKNKKLKWEKQVKKKGK